MRKVLVLQNTGEMTETGEVIRAAARGIESLNDALDRLMHPVSCMVSRWKYREKRNDKSQS